MKRMIKLVSILVLSVILFFVPITADASPIDNLVELESFIDGVIYSQMDEHNIVGVTLAVVQDGEIIMSKGYGYADRENRISVNPSNTLFRPGSTSKLFTWTAVMQLVEQGLIDLDADINEYLDFEIPDKLYGMRSSTAPEPITMAHLLTHTPGFEDQGANLFVLSAEEMQTLESYLKNNIPARVFFPGEVMAYSNYGTALAGYIVELVSGIPFAEYIEQNIYDPLDMRTSTFRQPLPDKLAPNMASGYNFYRGNYYKSSFEYINGIPAGGMSSTADDMAKFMIAHLQNGRYGEQRILQESTAQEMHRQQFTHHPLQDGMTYGFIEQSINGRRVINHGGNTFLFATGFYLLLEEDVGLFVSYNGGTGLEREALFTAFMDRYYRAPAEDALVPPEGSKERTAVFAGEYIPNRSNVTTIEKLLAITSSISVNVDEEGYLLVNIFGYPQQFVEIEPGVYDSRNTDGTLVVNRIVFVPDREGRMMMSAEGPAFTTTIAPWYGSRMTMGLLTGANLVLILTAIAGWIYAAVRRLLRKEKRDAPKAAFAARLTAIAYGILVILLILGLVRVVTDVDPAFDIPMIFLEGFESLNTLLVVPYLVAFAALAMLVFTILAWFKKFWTLGGRIHYTLITLSCLGFIWVMLYSNFL